MTYGIAHGAKLTHYKSYLASGGTTDGWSLPNSQIHLSMCETAHFLTIGSFMVLSQSIPHLEWIEAQRDSGVTIRTRRVKARI